MSNSSELRACPQCGEAIPAEAPQGLCPKCLLLQAALSTEIGAKEQNGSTAPAHEELAAAFPQLEILELIGHGGMGFVFKARQAKLDRFVALKILRQSLAGDPAFAERFAREGRLLARLSHPNIVAIYDFGQANGFFYLLMEFVDGVNLRQAMKAGRFTPDQALAIVPKICQALQFAHSEGILHRDIKPENILLDSKGRVKIADFGIAKLLGESHATSTLTGSGGALGTLHYMAPEQVEKPSQVDHRADIYSLGVVFYEMLAGELPIGRFAPPSESCAVDPRIDELVFRALDKKPERRPQSAGEVKTQVETISTTSPLSAPVESSSLPKTGQSSPKYEDAPTHKVAPRIRPGQQALAITAGVGLALVCLGAVTWQIWRLRHLPPVSESRPQNTPIVLGVVGGEVSTNEPFTRTIVLTRATNQVVGEAGDTWSAGIWSDTPLQPGEMLSARVRQDAEPISETGCHSLFFIHSQPEKVGTSASLGWYFGGVWRKEFGESEAEAAAAQLRNNISDRQLTITAGKPLMLFSVTNDAGGVLAGYAELTRYVPKPSPQVARSAPKPQAILHVRRFAAYLPSINYSVKLPPGYGVRATVNMGQVTTHYAPSPTGGEYYSAWYIPPAFRRGSSPADYRDLPAQMNSQRAALETRFQELQDLGPLPVILGEPYPVFSLTNKAGEVYRAFFELAGPSSAGATNELHAAKPMTNPRSVSSGVPLPPPQYVTPQNRRPAQGASPSDPAPNMPGSIPPPAGIDPATGLPVVAGGAATTAIDPATGLPLTRTLAIPSQPKGTNGTEKSTRN